MTQTCSSLSRRQLDGPDRGLEWLVAKGPDGRIVLNSRDFDIRPRKGAIRVAQESTDEPRSKVEVLFVCRESKDVAAAMIREFKLLRQSPLDTGSRTSVWVLGQPLRQSAPDFSVPHDRRGQAKKKARANNDPEQP